MKSSFLIVLVCGLLGGSAFAQYYPHPSSVTWVMDGLDPSPTLGPGLYCWLPGPAVVNEAFNPGPGGAPADGTAWTFVPSRTTAGVIIVGGTYDTSQLVHMGYWHPMAWYMCASGLTGTATPFGKYRHSDGAMVDINGNLVDTTTGIILPGQPAREDITITNPRSNLPYNVMIQLTEWGGVVETRMVTLLPGETRTIGLQAAAPFTAAWFDSIDGTASPLGSGSSTGGTSGVAGSSPPPVMTESPGATAALPVATQTATGETMTAIENAINRGSTIAVNGIEAARGAAAGETMALDGIQNQSTTNGVNETAGLAAVAAAITAQGPNTGGGTPITQAQTEAAVAAGLHDALDGTASTPGDGGTGIDAGLADTGIKDKFSALLAGLETIKASVAGLGTAVGFNHSYGSASWNATIDLPSQLGGSRLLDTSSFSGTFSVIRGLELFVLSLFFLRQYFTLIRGAFVS